MAYSASWEVGSQHTVTFQPPAGYDTYTITLTVGATNLTCTGCGTAGTKPYATVSSGYPAAVMAYLNPSSAVTSYPSWVASKGGSAGLRNNGVAVGQIIDGYYGLAQLGFTVVGQNVGATIDAYYGIGAGRVRVRGR